MRKIIQFLRFSRLVLLVILLLLAVVAKIARAETAYLYTNHYGATGLFGSAAAACAALPNFPGAEAGPIGAYTENGGHCFGQPLGQQRTSVGFWSRISKTCDAKELTHNGVSGGVPSLPEWHWMVAPPGIDAKDWYSDRFTSCENNCIVKNKREFLEPGDGVSSDLRSVTENDGTSRSMFTKRQTGEVCVVEKQKPDDPPKPPAPDTGDGTDGNGQSNPGSDSGDGQGQGNSQGGEGSQNGSNGQANQGSGNSNDSGSSSGGSGGGSGGNSGGSSHIIPGGNSNGGGSSGGDKNEGSEGSDGDGQSGDGKNGSGSGEGGGTDSENGSGQGNVNGAQNQGQGQGQSGQNGQSGGDGDSGEAGGHYFPCPSGKGSYKKGTEPSAECKGDGKGEGDGKGSVEGGNCETGQAPVCKGDPVQCYIAKEQWRTACAATGQSNNIESEGNCESNTPPKCKGDAVQCYMARQQWQQGCAAAAAQGAISELSQYGESQQGYLEELAREGNIDGLVDSLKVEKIDLVGKLDKNLVNLPDACPTFPPIDFGIFGQHEIPTDGLCEALRTFGRIMLAVSYIFGFTVIVRVL